MTYLELCKALHRELGAGTGALPGTLPSAVTGQTGELLRIVNWIADAWTEIQSSKSDWLWMLLQSTISATSGTQSYTITSTITDYERIVPWTAANDGRPYITAFKASLGATDTQPIYYIPAQEFVGYYDRASFTNTGRPIYYTLKRNGQIAFYPTPDATYTVNVPYRRTCVTLAADGDTPAMPAKHHMLIVYRAREYFGNSRESVREVGVGQSVASRMYRQLCNDQLPDFTMFGET